jgi:hypothetical protein
MAAATRSMLRSAWPVAAKREPDCSGGQSKGRGGAGRDATGSWCNAR